MTETAAVSSLSEFVLSLENELDAVMEDIDGREKSERVELSDGEDDSISGEEMAMLHSVSLLLQELEQASMLSCVDNNDVKCCDDSEQSLQLELLTPPSSTEKSEIELTPSPGDVISSSITSKSRMLLKNSHASILNLISADYSRWTGRCSLSNNKALRQTILRRYFGLDTVSRPMSSAWGEGDTSSGDVSIIHLLEIVLRPDTPTLFVMTGVSKVASLLGLEYAEVLPLTSSELECECVFNDTESTFTDCRRPRATGDLCAQRVGACSRSSDSSDASSACEGGGSSSGSGSKCRNSSGHALLCKAKASQHATCDDNPSEGGDSAATWSYVDVQVCLSTTLMQRVLLCQFIASDPSHTASLKRSTSAATRTSLPPCSLPAAITVFQVEKCFRQVFTRYYLSLSCLHALRGSAVMLPLDAAFSSLIEDHARQQMWERLRRDSMEVQRQLQIEESKFHAMKDLLLPIFKQHGLPPLRDLSVLSVLKRRQKTHVWREEEVRGKSCGAAIEMEGGDVLSSGSDDSCDEDTADSDARTDGDDTDEDDFEHEGGAVAKCLAELSVVKRHHQEHCDTELAHRLSCRHEGAREAIQSAHDRCSALLLYIVDNPISKISSLTRAFVTTFNDVVPVYIPVAAAVVQSDCYGYRRGTSPSQLSPSLSLSSSSSSPTSSRTPSPVHNTPASAPASWISRWMSKETPPPAVQTPDLSLGISRWMARGAEGGRSGAGGTNLSVSPVPQRDKHFPSVSREVVLFYCSCWQTYTMRNKTTSTGGYLYLTEHYVGSVSKSVMGLTQRKELFQLKHLRDVTLCNANASSSSTSSSTTSSPPSLSSSTSPSGADHDTPESTQRSLQGEGGRKGGSLLSSLATATGLSHLTSGCKLSFVVTPCGSSAGVVRVSPTSAAGASAHRHNNNCTDESGDGRGTVSVGKDEDAPGGQKHLTGSKESSTGEQAMVVDVMVIPSSISEAKLRTLLLGARSLPAPPSHTPSVH